METAVCRNYILANLDPDMQAWGRRLMCRSVYSRSCNFFHVILGNVDLFWRHFWARSHVSVCAFFRSVSAPFSGPPHGIPNISIPVDAFDVFEATQHTLEHDSKHGRGSPSVEQWCTSPLRSVWRVYKPNPPGHGVSWDSLLLCCTDWLHVGSVRRSS